MQAGPRNQSATGGAALPAAPAALLHLDVQRVEQALAHRTRYRYVQPSVLPNGKGWTVVSPNCSRNIDPQGGEIPIAWFEPDPKGPALWRVHARDHRANVWSLQAQGLRWAQALDLVCKDPVGRYWP
jgi:hypothetical protein